MIKVLIIDDESLARDVIKAFLRSDQRLEVIGECSNGFEGVKMIHDLNPDLIFLDIQMPKLTGFEMIELLDHVPVIIFSTAYDEYAIRAFDLSAADYLLKPYTQSRFNEAVEKAISKLEKNQSDTEVIKKIVEKKNENITVLDRIVVRLGHQIVIIPTDKIDYIEAEDDYVNIHSDGKKYLKQLTMKYLEDALPSDEFVRVHRSHIIAVNQIDRLEAYTKDAYIVILRNGHKVPVSRKGYNALRQVLNF